MLRRVLGSSRTWRSRPHPTRRPNLWRLVSSAPPPSFHQIPELTVSPWCSILCVAGSSTGSIKARFENLAKQKEEEDRQRAEEERARRQAREQQEQEEARRKTERAPSPVQAPSPTPPVQPAAAYQVGSGSGSIIIMTLNQSNFPQPVFSSRTPRRL